MLPQAFLNRMESMLGNEYPAFLESYDKDKYQALRLNSIKGDTAQMKEKVPFSLQPVAWAKMDFTMKKMTLRVGIRFMRRACIISRSRVPWRRFPI